MCVQGSPSIVMSGSVWNRESRRQPVMCTECENEQNAELQVEEIEVLQAIFGNDFQLRTEYDNAAGTRSFTVSVPGPHAIVLLVHLPHGYPSTDAPVAEVYESFGLTNSQRDGMIKKLTAIFNRSRGQVCLYEWIETVRETYTTSQATFPAEPMLSDADVVSTSPQRQSTPSFESHPQTLRPQTRTAQALRDPEREARLAPLIFHSESLVDRKSVFQGHACPVANVGDVRSFLALLLDDRKVGRACHNMLAYRITEPFTIKDNDEDREDGAGSKMLHLMELTGAKNVAVVVTRWCGGVLLGPDRFKHINTCARQALEGGGFIDASLPQSRKKKHRK